MRRIAIIKAGLVAALIFTVGCEGNVGGSRTVDASSGAPREVQPSFELVATSRPPIPDLPVPIGFGLDEGKSRDYAFSGGRFVDHVYKGKGDKFAVKRFYERQMPINRWVLSTEMFIRGDISMDFEKETERCRIVVTGGGSFQSTYIEVQLSPSGRVESPAEQK
ncbi:MAG: hypothetical protein ACYSTL_06295 [Planctomycetota bacterium]|jgi:hypothetical protein